MNRWNLTGLGMVGGALAGAVLGMALLANPVAYAADGVLAVPVPPYPLPYDFEPPGVGGAQTDLQQFSIPYLYSSQEFDQIHTIFGQDTSDPTGSYLVHEVDQTFGPQTLQDFPVFSDTSDKVIGDVSGSAPAVGTEWDNSSLAQSFTVAGGLPETIIYSTNSSITTPTGTMADIWDLFGMTNEFYHGPAGTFDFLVFGDGTPIPIIDLPADSAPVAGTDFATLWSDLVAAL